VTDRGLGICDLARQVEAAGLESLFLVQNTHVPVSGAALLDEEDHQAGSEPIGLAVAWLRRDVGRKSR
jgi:hypothetical protein